MNSETDRQVNRPLPNNVLSAIRKLHNIVNQLYFNYIYMYKLRSFPSGSEVKNPPPMKETQIQSLGQEAPLEEGMATHSSILAWRIPWIEEPGRLQSLESQRVRQD